MKILIVCLLASLAFAQDNDTDPIQAELDANRVELLLNIQENYDTSQAQQSRRNHLFCLDRTTTVATNDDGNDEATVRITEFEQRGGYVLTLFLQVPVITYLDPQRKLSLIDTILKVIDPPIPDELTAAVTLDNLCIGTYETYQLSYFQESVVVHLYGRDFNLSASMWANLLNDRIEDVVGDDNGYVVRYPEQSDVIAFNFSTSPYFTNLIQPFQPIDGDLDLTTLAVFIGAYGYNYTFAEGTNDAVSRNIESQSRRSFAENTNPINYGLEPGDIVFAVFGSILLTITCGLIILGYCIHPFFLA